MPKLSWSAFIERHPAAHLVAVVIPEEDVAIAGCSSFSDRIPLVPPNS